MIRPNIDEIIEACESDEYDGFCLSCGERQCGGVEPDARKYSCETCDANAVYGAQECLIMFCA